MDGRTDGCLASGLAGGRRRNVIFISPSSFFFNSSRGGVWSLMERMMDRGGIRWLVPAPRVSPLACASPENTCTPWGCSCTGAEPLKGLILAGFTLS